MYKPDVAVIEKEVLYPESDGQPMADNTLQFDMIVLIKTNLDILFEEADVFIAGDLFWYPVKGAPKKVVAPDVMVVFDRPKGYRGSYKQWEENNIPPTVAIEVLSKSNSAIEMTKKLAFYQAYGVEEYIVINPYTNVFTVLTRQNQLLTPVDLSAKIWKSEKLDITMEAQDDTLNFYFPDGQPFRMPEEWRSEREKERLGREQAEQERDAERLAKEKALQELAELKAQLKKG